MEVTEAGVRVDELVDVVKHAVRTANATAGPDYHELRAVSIKLTLHTVATTGAGGGLDFRVPFLGMKLKLGGSVSRQDTHAIEMTLVPPDLPRHELRDRAIETVLVDAIATIRQVMARAAQGDDPFLLESSYVDLTFAVTKTGSITLGIEGELKDEVTHRLRVGLARPARD
jgi:hypothetical protein